MLPESKFALIPMPPFTEQSRYALGKEVLFEDAIEAIVPKKLDN
tara:strand:- start:135 stop:266 length:132 start_codon:yes stop_codon:yes gene_type:complete